ncbi:hypothetical protein ILUMI_07687 [Ignelater luminosus]|uniref:Uncharacterized protein n=1 Tax=Ignelater luminosus TaxID=2038154 RepID=A0A8K0D7T5_IGNLU|nr:hypothetical protein ILUMI_07687 [Ignelater luminosus]
MQELRKGNNKELFLTFKSLTDRQPFDLLVGGLLKRVLEAIKNIKPTELLSIWVVQMEKTRIPIREEQHCISKLENFYHKWRDIHKPSERTTTTQKQNVEKFQDQLEDLFDIAHANALDIISIEEDRQFLLSQRQKGRPGLCLELVTN